MHVASIDPIMVMLDAIIEKLGQHPIAASAMRRSVCKAGRPLAKLEKSLSPAAAAIVRDERERKGEAYAMMVMIDLAIEQISDAVEAIVAQQQRDGRWRGEA